MEAAFTRADYMRLPEGFPAQLIEGCLVREPAPTFNHRCVQMRLSSTVAALVGSRRAVMAPLDILIDDLNIYQPDLVVFARPQSMDTDEVEIPILAMEILSPSTEGRDRNVKTRRLLGAGVREVWLIDPREATIEIHTVNGVREASGAGEASSRVVEGLRVVPAELFAPDAP